MSDCPTPAKRGGPEQPDQNSRRAAQLELSLQDARGEAAALKQQLSEANKKVKKAERELARQQEYSRRTKEDKQELVQKLEVEREQ